MDLGQRNKVSVTGNMSSMTDLVFLLLIFFIILSTLASNTVTAKLTLSIKSDESYYINGGAVSKDDIESVLSMRLEDMNEKIIYLEVDARVPTGATVEMIGMAKANNWKVMLGASPKKE